MSGGYAKMLVPLASFATIQSEELLGLAQAKKADKKPKEQKAEQKEPKVEKATQDDGPEWALLGTADFLRGLHEQLGPQLGACVKVGLIKDTEAFGNTSVSMGVSQLNLAGVLEGQVLCANCGTGGVKLQLYVKERGILRLKQEEKGSAQQPRSPNQFGTEDSDEAIEALGKEWAQRVEAVRREWRLADNVPVRAFVTGTTRNVWEKADLTVRKGMERRLTLFFKAWATSWNASSFFMTQNNEAEMEYEGTARMYANLCEARLLPEGVRVCGVAGIGRGSTQVSFAPANVEVLLDVGMARGQELRKRLAQAPAALTPDEPDERSALVKTFEQVPQPVLALKSGCALLLPVCSERLQQA